MSLCSSGGDSRTDTGNTQVPGEQSTASGETHLRPGLGKDTQGFPGAVELTTASMSLKGRAPEGNPYGKGLWGLQRQELKEKLALPVFNWRQSLGSK